MQAAASLDIRSLCKSFLNKQAVADVDLRLEPGVLYGLLGPDGSGKTTVLRLLAGVLEPDSGAGEVLGKPFPKGIEDAKHHMGYMPQRFGLYGDLTVWENLLFYARVHHVERSARHERMEDLLSFSNLLPFKERLADKLSGGMKQKLGLACALIHRPRLLLLDEPTSGVDPVSRREFWDILSELLGEGVTMLVATTYLDEAERCHRVGLLHQGRLIRQGSPEELKASVQESLWELKLEQGVPDREELLRMPAVVEAVRFGESLHVAVAPDCPDPEKLWQQLGTGGASPVEARAIEPSLEDVYILAQKRAAAGDP